VEMEREKGRRAYKEIKGGLGNIKKIKK